MTIKKKLVIAFAFIGALLPIFFFLMLIHVTALKSGMYIIGLGGIKTANSTDLISHYLYQVDTYLENQKRNVSPPTLRALPPAVFQAETQINHIFADWRQSMRAVDKYDVVYPIKIQNQVRQQQIEDTFLPVNQYLTAVNDYLLQTKPGIAPQQLDSLLVQAQNQLHKISLSNYQLMLENLNLVDKLFMSTRIRAISIITTLFLLSLFVSVFMAWSTLKRLKTLQNATNALAQQNFEIRIKDTHHDEVSVLNDAFNHMAASLHKAHLYIENIIQTMPNIFLVTSQNHQIKSFNKTSLTLLGYSKDELYGKSIQALFSTHEPADKIGTSLKTSMIRKDQSELMVFLSSTSLKVEDGHFEYIYIAQDISELDTMQKELVLSARQTGMAEIASSVLHNVGNVLTSIKVSAQILQDNVLNSKIQNLPKLAQLLESHHTDLLAYLNKNENAITIAKYIDELSNSWENERDQMSDEVTTLQQNIEHIRHIITIEQSMYKLSGLVESCSIATLINDALSINKVIYDRSHAQITKNLDNLRNVSVDRIKLLQVVVNLVKNAIEALDEGAPTTKKLVINAEELNHHYFMLQVKDNGIGIDKANLDKVFSYGFTTKVNGHGFGLHGSALSIKEMGGKIMVQSAGRNQGATFTLILPTSPEYKISSNDQELERLIHLKTAIISEL